MSAHSQEPTSYFEYRKAPNQNRSDNSTPISPTGLHQTRKPQPALIVPPTRPARPIRPDRTTSDYTTYLSTQKFHVIQEDAVARDAGTQDITPPIVKKVDADASTPAQHAQRSVSTSSRRVAAYTGSSAASLGRVSQSADSSEKIATSTFHEQERSTPLRRPKLGQKWSRTMSGSVWYQRPPSAASTVQSIEAVRVPSNLLIPLPPPKLTRRYTNSPAITHSVRIERSFQELPKVDLPKNETGKEASISQSHDKGSRRSSFNPRKFFSAPVISFRKLSLPKTIPAIPTLEVRETIGEPVLPGHRSQLKKTYTPDVLREASAILRQVLSSSDTTLLRPAHQLTWRNVSDMSNSSGEVNEVHGSWMRRGMQSATTMYRRTSRVQTHVSKSWERAESDTSSQLERRMGRGPETSPGEQATYKIKRSPTADTEQFFKIDISIRGGTSYLPSEARRIHTPPLPGEGNDGRKRGFFFDYNPPSHKRPSVKSQPIPGISRSATVDTIAKKNGHGSSTLTKQQGVKTNSRIKTGDWYATQLAEIDAEPRPSFSASGDQVSRTSSLAFSHFQDSDPEEAMDLSIPEHLPSSPLCPRHPRYWRVVKGKGSQYRGCWMHGVGEFEMGEWILWQPGLELLKHKLLDSGMYDYTTEGGNCQAISGP